MEACVLDLNALHVYIFYIQISFLPSSYSWRTDPTHTPVWATVHVTWFCPSGYKLIGLGVDT